MLITNVKCGKQKYFYFDNKNQMNSIFFYTFRLIIEKKNRREEKKREFLITHS